MLRLFVDLPKLEGDHAVDPLRLGMQVTQAAEGFHPRLLRRRFLLSPVRIGNFSGLLHKLIVA